MSITIRKATPHDIPSIRQIADTTWPATYSRLLSAGQVAYMLNMMYSETSLQEQMAKGHQFFLAELEGKTLGFASVSHESDNRYKLNKLYVLPDIQKTGAGTALLQQSIDYAKKNNAVQLFLQVKKDNPAKGFYEKQGFAVIDEVQLDIGNGYLMDDYIMTLNLQ